MREPPCNNSTKLEECAVKSRHKFFYYREVLMTDYHEILRLLFQGISQRNISRSCRCSRNTVARVLTRTQQRKLEWGNLQNLSDGDLQQLLFPDRMQPGSRQAPDCAYIHKEMAKSGVTLSLLWHEYCDEYRGRHEIPLVSSI
jgi:hypothetical protein